MHMIARGLRENRVFLVTSILILFILLIAFLAPHIAPYDPLSASMKDANLAPSSSHIFGTDKLGRDVFSRILCGAERSLSSVLFLVALIFVVGTTAGVISGYAGGIVDIVIMRIADMMISFPGIILAIAISGIMGPSLINAMLALTVVTWTKYARLSRSLVLKLKESEFEKLPLSAAALTLTSFASYSAKCPSPSRHYGRCRYRRHDDGTGRTFLPRIREPAAAAGMGPHAE